MNQLKSLIREEPDYPKPGILFYDITTLLKHLSGVRAVIDTLRADFEGHGIDRLVGIEAQAPATSHGVALSPDEKEVWVTDGANSRVHIFDNTAMPPTQIMSVMLPDELFWLTFSANGKRVYSSSGDIIDATSKKVIASLKDEVGREVQGEESRRGHLPGGQAVEDRRSVRRRQGVGWREQRKVG